VRKGGGVKSASPSLPLPPIDMMMTKAISENDYSAANWTSEKHSDYMWSVC